MAKSEGLSTEQLQSIWDGVRQEARRCIADSIFQDEAEVEEFTAKYGGLGVRLVRPQVIQSGYFEEWIEDPQLVDKSNHLNSRILVVGVGEKAVKEGKAKIRLSKGRFGEKVLTLTWNDQELEKLRLDRLIGAVDYPYYVDLEDGTSEEITKNNILFTEVLLPKPDSSSLIIGIRMGTGLAANLPVGFKEVFNKKTGMMIERP